MFKRVIFVLVLLHGYVAWRLLPDLPQPAAAWGLGLWLLLSCVLVPVGMVHRHLARPPHASRLAWLGFGALGVFSALLMLTVLRDLLVALLPGLSPALQSLRIVQISDVHVGPTIGHGFVERLVEQANALDADLVAVTGDLVDGPGHELRDHLEPLAQLKARLGCFFVTGNHEYYAGCHPWLPEFKRLGLRVLLNAHEVIERRAQGHSARLVVAGVTDWSAHRFDSTHRSDPRAALRGAPEQADLRLLLAHQPRSAAAAEEAGFDVQLSGHTHGGQLWPWIYLVYLQQPYLAGLHRHGRLWVYVSRGSGYWGPPQRLGAPSEVTLITLTCDAASAGRRRARHSVSP